MSVIALFRVQAKACPFCGAMPARYAAGFAHPGDHRDDSCPLNGRVIRDLAAWNRRVRRSAV